MPFGPGGKSVKKKAGSGTKPRTKVERGAARRAARDLSRKGTTRVDDVAREPEAEAEEPEPVPVPTLSEREGMGLLKLDQEMVRNYVIVAYATRFQEPAEEDWKSIIAILISEGVPTSARTIRQILKNCQAGNTSAKQKSGAGRKRKLEPDNVGLAAAARALNGGISPKFATEICNEANRISQGEDYEPVCRNTLMDAIEQYNLLR